MSVEHILLGLLAEPSTGYDLKKVFDEVFSHFWAAEQSQIYRTLKVLEARGLVESREAAPDKGPPRRLYQRTAGGRRRLLAWLASPPGIPTLRFPYLAQLLFMSEVGSVEHTESWLRELVEESEARLAALLEIEAEFPTGPPAPGRDGDEEHHALMVLRHGVHRQRATLAWARECLERTRRRAQGVDGATDGVSPEAAPTDRRAGASAAAEATAGTARGPRRVPDPPESR